MMIFLRLTYTIITLFFIFSSVIACAPLTEKKNIIDYYEDLYSTSLKNDDFDIILKEVSRTKNTSTLYVYIREGSSVGVSVFIGCSFSNIAKKRGFKYFITLEEEMDKVGYKYLVGFLNEQSLDALNKLTGNKFHLDIRNIFEVTYFEKFCN
jgi:hypothetical protein